MTDYSKLRALATDHASRVGLAAADTAQWRLGCPPGAVLELLDEVENGTCARHADQRHGAEAEELRRGIEDILKNTDWKYLRSELQRLLDDVDARDSLAYLEAKDEKLATLTRERDEARAEVERLKYSNARLLVAKLPTADDYDRIVKQRDLARREVERWRPVVEAAKAWHRVNTGMHTTGPQHMLAQRDTRNALIAAIDTATKDPSDE